MRVDSTVSNTHFKCTLQALWARVAGGVLPLHRPYRYELPQRVAFLCRFGLKIGIDFAQFGLESGMNISDE